MKNNDLPEVGCCLALGCVALNFLTFCQMVVGSIATPLTSFPTAWRPDPPKDLRAVIHPSLIEKTPKIRPAAGVAETPSAQPEAAAASAVGLRRAPGSPDAADAFPTGVRRLSDAGPTLARFAGDGVIPPAHRTKKPRAEARGEGRSARQSAPGGKVFGLRRTASPCRIPDRPRGPARCCRAPSSPPLRRRGCPWPSSGCTRPPR